MADARDFNTELGETLESAGARLVFDRGNNGKNPCTNCGTRPPPDTMHETLRIGTYPNGDPIRRPVCSQCMQFVEAREKAAPLPKLAEHVCPDCRLPRCPEGEPFDLGNHCPASWSGADHRETPGLKLLAERDCLRFGLDKARVTEQRTIEFMRTIKSALGLIAEVETTGDVPRPGPCTRCYADGYDRCMCDTEVERG